MTDKKSPYFDSSGRPQLTLAYCVFADVIGFQNMTAEALRKKEGNDLLARLREIISTFANDYRDWDIKYFTDNIVIGQPTRRDDTSESDFGSTIMPIMEYQLNMALNGFFLRGGFTIGSLFLDDYLVFGSALLEAHEIEQSTARDPRIVLSKSLLNLVKKHVGYYGKPEISPQFNEILIDSDGNAFINYLTLLIDNAEYLEDLSDSWNGLEKHKQQIESGLVKYREKPEIWSKYYWLANYHNYFCEDVRHLPGYNKKLRIDSRLLGKRLLRITQNSRPS
jgi:hypothetical protein